MIRCLHLTKTYSTSSETVQALRDITCSFPNQGMYFITGKSGSGKSTLLNLLGALDRPDSGEVMVDGRPIFGFSTGDMDSYRNSHVGFVFQDNNLITHLSIRENIEIALTLQGIHHNDQAIRTVLDRVGLPDVENRKPYQLSGGQQQRIAIARALVKRPLLILADEPTGNLDKETGKMIFQLLKDISRDTLVLVVSHDDESAKAFGDGILHLSDGLIDSETVDFDNSPGQLNEKSGLKSSEHHSTLSAKMAFHLGVENLKHRGFRTFLSIFIFVISLFITSMALVLDRYELACGTEATLSMNGDQYIHFYPSVYDRFGILSKTQEDITRENIASWTSIFGPAIRSLPLIFYEITSDGFEMITLRKYGIITSLSDLTGFGLVFYEGSQEITDETIVVSDLFYESILSETENTLNSGGSFSKVYFVLDGESEIPLTDDLYDYETIIGKTINYYIGSGDDKDYGTPFSISAIYQTGYSNFLDDHLQIQSSLSDTKRREWTLLEGHVFLTYATNAYVNAHGNPPAFRSFSYGKTDTAIQADELVRAGFEVSVGAGESPIPLDYELGFQKLVSDDWEEMSARTLTDVGLIDSNVDFETNEVVISLGLYNKIFQTSLGASDFFDGETVLTTPEHIGETVSLQITDSANSSSYIEQPFIIAGVFVPEPEYLLDIPQSTLYLDTGTFDLLQNASRQVASVLTLYIGEGTIDPGEVISEMSEAGFYPYFAASDIYYKYEIGINQIGDIIGLIGYVMLGLSFAIITNLISISVSSSRKEIGIMKALGATNRNLYLIFLVESLLVGSLVLLLSLLSSPAIILLDNFLISKTDTAVVKFVTYDFIVPLFSLMASGVIPVLSTVLPIRKIVRLAPVEAIRTSG